MSKFAYALAASVLMIAAGSSGAMAGGKHFRHHGFGNNFHSFHHYNHRPILRLSIGGGGCGYLYHKWMQTGRFYWKKEYYLCKGWW